MKDETYQAKRMRFYKRNIEAFELFLSGLNWRQVSEIIGVTPNRLHQTTGVLCRRIVWQLRRDGIELPFHRYEYNTVESLRNHADFWREELNKLKHAAFL